MAIPEIEFEIKKTIPLPDNPQTSDLPANGDVPASVDISGGYETRGDAYIRVYDDDHNLVDGNNMLVTFQEYYNGFEDQPRTVSIPGNSYTLQTNIVFQRSLDGIRAYDARIVSFTANDGSYTPPGVCDANILSVITNRLAGVGGNNDGQITIQASSSYGPLQYKLNNGEYQFNATFSNLAGGGYTAYIKDAQGCEDSRTFTLESVNNLLSNDPTLDAGNGNISRWSAAFNPVVFTYQRRDFSISSIEPYAFFQKTKFRINGALSANGTNGATTLAADDCVYIEAGAYQGVYKVSEVDLYNSSIVIDTPYVAAATSTGFININKLRPYYCIKTKIRYEDKLTGKTETIEATHQPNRNGITKADLSNFLQSLLRAKDESNFTQANYRDDNLSASYYISYAEVWQDVSTGKETEPNYLDLPDPYYVTYSARQLGDAYGGNMAAFVPFKTVDGTSRRARWLTDFTEPAYSPGYPFDIGFIYSEVLAGLNIYCELTPLDINRQPLPDGVLTSFLLNENSSFMLNQDGSKLVIRRQAVTSEPITQDIAQHIGLNRLLIKNNFASQVHYFTIALKYADTEGTIHTITRAQTIRVDQSIDEESVYLRWIGLTGSWNYYRFVYNQEVSLDVQNAVIVKNQVLDWANQDAMEDVISKSAGIKMKVMAEDLSVADIRGLQSIKYSPKVQMLVSKNPVKWKTVILNTATFAEYETRNGQAPFSITFNLPAINIQTQ